EPAARAGRVGEGHDDRSSVHVALADRLAERADAEQPSEREPADGHDQRRLEQAQLVLVPARAERLLDRRGRAVAAAGGGLARVAARNRGAVEGGVEVVLLQPQPAAQGGARAPAPGPALLALELSRRLAEQVRALAGPALEHRPRAERVAGLDAAPAARVVALQRAEGAVAALVHRSSRRSGAPKRRRFPSGSTTSISRNPWSASSGSIPSAAARPSTSSTWT